MLKNKKATIGATMTWIVATIIILVVISFFVYLSWGIATKKGIESFSFIQKNKFSSSIDSQEMLFAILKTNIKGEKVEVKAGDEKWLEENLKPILNKLPKINSDNFLRYSLLIGDKEINSEEFNPLPHSSIYIPDTRDLGYVYLNSKKIKLRAYCANKC